MTTGPNNAPQPPPTPRDIFEHGTPVWVIAGPRSQTIEDWVQGLASITGLRIDWRQIGGRCVVLVLGDRAACLQAQSTITEQLEALRDQYMACTFNWVKTPQRSDVSGYPLDLSD